MQDWNQVLAVVGLAIVIIVVLVFGIWMGTDTLATMN
jgi:FtsZ-interacting cell division protein ZipA